ncbi:MAG: oxidoreductase [Fibrobacteres bacterium]|nr:oxidoreductase [Fibrobacterota bacterium]
MDEKLKTAPFRNPGHPVDPIFPNRWSPRAMSGAHLSRETLATLFEAARWAPSAFNNQPWRFVYALRGGEAWPRFLALLTPRNQLWCAHAGALILIVSKNTFDHNGKPSLTHSFDAGSAWMSLALQASLLGLVAHGMQGFDYGMAGELVGLPDGYSVEAMCAVGHPGSPEVLPEDLREKEKPNGRKPVAEVAFEGHFPANP